MCARFTLILGPEGLKMVFEGFEFPVSFLPRYNIAPGQDILVLPNDGKETARYFRWGLLPSWATDPKVGNRMINARAETLEKRPFFQMAFEKRRCLIPADGFYEWREEPGSSPKRPIYIRMKSAQPFAFAGLWETYRRADGDVLNTCAIITTEPNDLLKKIHYRMPAILEPKSYDEWLDPNSFRPGRLRGLLEPYPSEGMAAHPVSRTVNDFRHDSPECIAPLKSAGIAGRQESLPL